MENLQQRTEALILLRKELHKNPELSGKELETAKRIIAFLEKQDPDEIITEIGGSGIAAIYKSNRAGKTVMFRYELEVLPIDESNTLEQRSLTNGGSNTG